ncbi:DUF6904 family protein [Mucilaginibacter gilvus]|uniref:DUF6904 family protein n=1 Tax=Mucilaginibacter gilvus TaxID=2305909 RepID=UPI0037427B4F
MNALYETVDQIVNSLNEDNKHQKGQQQLLMNLAYEVRKAYSGHRLIQYLPNSNTCFGHK